MTDGEHTTGTERSQSGMGPGCAGAGAGGLVIGVMILLMGYAMYGSGSGSESSDAGTGAANPVDAIAWLFQAAGVLLMVIGAALALSGLGGIIIASQNKPTTGTSADVPVSPQETTPEATLEPTSEPGSQSTDESVAESDAVPEVASVESTPSADGKSAGCTSAATGCLMFIGAFLAVPAILLPLVGSNFAPGSSIREWFLSGGRTLAIVVVVIGVFVVALKARTRRRAAQT